MRKQFLKTLLITLILLVIFVVPVLAQAEVPPGEESIDFWTKVMSWLKPMMPTLLALIGLVFVDVLFGISAAIKEKKFDWAKVGDFYLTMVIPLILGWVGLLILALMATEAILGPVYGALVGQGVGWLAWLAVVAKIGSSIVANAKKLWGNDVPFSVGPGE